MATTLAKGARITGTQRESLAKTFAKRYGSGDSIRRIAEDCNRSFGFVHGVLKESGTALRGRGGATRGVKRTVTTTPEAKASTKTPTAAKKSATPKKPATTSTRAPADAAAARPSAAKKQSTKPTAKTAAAKR